jgi:hypothetical protein
MSARAEIVPPPAPSGLSDVERTEASVLRDDVIVIDFDVDALV